MARHHSTGRLVTLTSLAFLCGLGSATTLPVSARSDRASPFHLTTLAADAESLGAAVAAPVLQTPVRKATVAEARDFSTAFADIAETVTPAVVRIQTERSMVDAHGNMNERMRDFFDRLPEGHPAPPLDPQIAGGTGVLVAADGLILTNNHVIEGADRITVTLWDKREFDATVVGADPTTDVALITVDAKKLPAVHLGDSDALRVGEWVLAIGNPGFSRSSTLDFTVTSGIVSAKGRPLDIIRQELQARANPAAPYAIEDFIQTDAAINPGNSGGPLIDLNGEVVGINTAIASGTGFNEGYGFAIPVNVAKRVIHDLLEYGRVRRPLLGISIQNISPEDAQVYTLPRIAGVLVEDFADDSPAERAGLERNDVIVSVDGDAVERLGQFQRLIARHQPGESVRVGVIRYGRSEAFDVKLTEARLGTEPVVRTAADVQKPEELGLELVDLTPSLARERGFRQGGGVLIASVATASAAARKGVPDLVLVREINRTPVRSADQAEQILRALPSGSVVSLLLQYAAGTTTIRNIRVP